MKRKEKKGEKKRKDWNIQFVNFNKVLGNSYQIFKSSLVSRHTRIQRCNIFGRPTLFYSSEL